MTMSCLTQAYFVCPAPVSLLLQSSNLITATSPSWRVSRLFASRLSTCSSGSARAEYSAADRRQNIARARRGPWHAMACTHMHDA